MYIYKELLLCMYKNCKCYWWTRTKKDLVQIISFFNCWFFKNVFCILFFCGFNPPPLLYCFFIYQIFGGEWVIITLNLVLHTQDMNVQWFLFTDSIKRQGIYILDILPWIKGNIIYYYKDITNQERAMQILDCGLRLMIT